MELVITALIVAALAWLLVKHIRQSREVRDDFDYEYDGELPRERREPHRAED